MRAASACMCRMRRLRKQTAREPVQCTIDAFYLEWSEWRLFGWRNYYFNALENAIKPRVYDKYWVSEHFSSLPFN